MYSREVLIDIHERCHASVIKLLAHCRRLSEDELNHEFPDFGGSTVATQIEHGIGAERYWVGVIAGEMLVEGDERERWTVDALEALRAEVAETTLAYLSTATPEELNTVRPMTTWGGNAYDIAPAHVILRPLTHYFQHQGQILAMCRLMGKPARGLDFFLFESKDRS